MSTESPAAPAAARWRPVVVDTVGDVLGRTVDQVHDADSLFDLPGFDSVAIVAVLERLEDAGGVEVPPDRILPEAFESVDALCALLADAQGAGPRGTAPGGTP